MDTATSIRKPFQAGRFYPADEADLRSMVARFLHDASVHPSAEMPLGFVVPHAGYSYSGATAAWAYRQLQAHPPDLVILLAPSHHANFPLVSYWEGSAYATPLGEYPIDQDAIMGLARLLPGMATRKWAEEMEHALEVQIPFLQVACPDAKIIPLLVGAQDRRNLHPIVKALASFCSGFDRGRFVLVASSDAYHGHRLQHCIESDRRLAELIGTMESERLLDAIESKETMACGYGPISIVMDIVRRLGARKSIILKQATSADVIPYRDGDYVVGYLSAMFC